MNKKLQMSYHGKYRPQNPTKYRGDPKDIIYRSSWERSVFKWCDTQSCVLQWSSETVVIPYRCKTDKQMHRYFVDLYIKLESGKELLVEIKPEIQTKPPEKRSKVTRKYLGEVLTYAKNISKWKAAESYALDRRMTFEIWSERTMKNMGIKVLT